MIPPSSSKPRFQETPTGHGTPEGFSIWVDAGAFSPDRRLLASGSDGETVRLLDPMTEDPRATRKDYLSWEVGYFCRLLASGSDDKTVRLWSPVTWDSPGSPFL